MNKPHEGTEEFTRHLAGEQTAQDLAYIGIQLHHFGFWAPYDLVIKARNSLLDILDKDFPSSSIQG